MYETDVFPIVSTNSLLVLPVILFLSQGCVQVAIMCSFFMYRYIEQLVRCSGSNTLSNQGNTKVRANRLVFDTLCSLYHRNIVLAKFKVTGTYS